MKYILPLFLLFLFSSCQRFGEVVERNNTSVYYKEKGLRSMAQRTAAYLEEKHFTGGTINSIQITRDTIYNVRIMMSKDLALNRALHPNFKVLGASMADAVFGGSEINFQLCDNRFRTLRTIPINQSRL